MIRMTLLLLSLGLSAFFGYLFNAHYLKWRSCFDELGRCFDANSGVVYHEQSGVAWLSLTILTLLAAIIQAWRILRSS